MRHPPRVFLDCLAGKQYASFVTTAFQIEPRPLYQKHTPVRDEAYKRWVKTWPCCFCGQPWHIDPCHTGPHALGVKADDSTVIPGCRACHEKYDADPRSYSEACGVDVPVLVARLNHVWELKQGKGGAA